MNQYPLWKNLLILGVILGALLFAVPNLFSQDPSIEITAARGSEVTEASVAEIRAALETAGVPFKEIETREGGKLLVRFPPRPSSWPGRPRSSGPSRSAIARR
jgi:preprotein translocase subunit SecD